MKNTIKISVTNGDGVVLDLREYDLGPLVSAVRKAGTTKPLAVDGVLRASSDMCEFVRDEIIAAVARCLDGGAV